jgi:Na+-driven multidrug efflux pump
MWFFRAFLGATLCITILGYGLPAAVWCMVADSYVRILLFFLRYRTGKWKNAARVVKAMETED